MNTPFADDYIRRRQKTCYAIDDAICLRHDVIDALTYYVSSIYFVSIACCSHAVVAAMPPAFIYLRFHYAIDGLAHMINMLPAR